MKKDSIRDYATEAFRFYAACGRLTGDEIRKKLLSEIYDESKRELINYGTGNMPSDKTASTMLHADEQLEHFKAEILDIMAVERTLKRLTPEMLKAVEIVYFTDPNKPMARGELSARVHMAEMKIPASERNIYYWLRQARRIFADERELRQD